MHKLIYFTAPLIAASVILFSCKKSNSGQANYNDSTSILQMLTYKVSATKASPWDSANILLSDSFGVTNVLPTAYGDYLSLYPGINLTISNSVGFEFGYAGGGNAPFYYFVFDSYSIPGLNGDFLLNKAYENTSYTYDLFSPVIFTMGNESAVMGHYFEGTTPSDANSDPALIKATTYCKMVFTNKYSMDRNGISNFADGHLTGYKQLSYGTTDSTKYVQRWDYDIKFRGLIYENN